MARNMILTRIDRELSLNKAFHLTQFVDASPSNPSTFAFVYPNDTKHLVHLDQAFQSAPATGQDSKAGTLVHDMSHFTAIGATKDYVYGVAGARALAQTKPGRALRNADNFEYYVEGVH
jgi:peptidyl-Lys metalloendopeptidase